jgi:hypothetical protein
MPSTVNVHEMGRQMLDAIGSSPVTPPWLVTRRRSLSSKRHKADRTTRGLKGAVMKTWNVQAILSWALQLAVAGILLQTLFFKFTGAPESIYIFSTLGAEPWGRIGSGVAELIASLMLLTPATATMGAALAIGLMMGAIGSHLTVLGIEIQGDGGLLFALAVIVFAASVAILVLRRGEIPFIGMWLRVHSATL